MKEEDIRKRDVLNRYLELVAEDSRRLFSDRSTLVEVPCPACGDSSPEGRFTKMGFSYVQCTQCDTLFVSPRPAYRDLMKIYVDSPSTKFWVNDFFLPMVEARREKIFKPRAQFIADRFPDMKNKRMADIGAGFGLFLEEMKKLWPTADIVAIEPSREMAQICRSKSLAVLENSLEDINPAERFDLMTSFELFEHLHDPLPFICKARSLLNPGGYLFITTLNALGFDIQVLWERAKSVFPPQHLNFFNPHSLSLLLEREGFVIAEIGTPGQLDWDIVEGAYTKDGIDPGRFFKTLSHFGGDKAKNDFQQWLQRNNFSSHMRVIARKK